MQRIQELKISTEVSQTKLNMTQAINGVMDTMQEHLLAGMKSLIDNNESLKQTINKKMNLFQQSLQTNKSEKPTCFMT